MKLQGIILNLGCDPTGTHMPSMERRCYAVFYEATNPFPWGKVTTLQSELALHISARIGIFRKHVDSLFIRAKADIGLTTVQKILGH